MRWPLLGLAVVLGACASSPRQLEYTMSIRSASVPTVVKAGGTLRISFVAVDTSGCSTEPILEASRTRERLTLRVLGRRPADGGAYPPVVREYPTEFLDAPEPRRNNPFTVIINGQSYSVTVEP